MWPFGKKTHELIDTSYLEKRRIPIEYREAFNWSKKELKDKVKTLYKERDQRVEEISFLEAKIGTNNMLKAQVDAELDALTEDGKDQQEIKRKDLEANRLASEVDLWADEQNSAELRKNIIDRTLQMLDSIIDGTKKTPKELTEKSRATSGDHLEEAIDEMPSRHEHDASSIIDHYAKRRKDQDQEE